jgi:CelD/BcsL family acetyltransferase involved in cellulose biosynthesis
VESPLNSLPSRQGEKNLLASPSKGDCQRSNSKLAIRVISSLVEFESLRGTWNELLDSSSDRHIFLTWEWQFTWWKHFGSHGRLNILVAEDSDGIAAIAPLMRSRFGIGPLVVEALQSISYDVGDYGGFILGNRSEEAVALFTEYLASEIVKNNAIVTISRVPEDSDLMRLLRNMLVESPVVALREPSAFSCPFQLIAEMDLSGIPRKSDLPRRVRRLGENYEVGFSYHANGHLNEAMETLVKLHGSRWTNKTEEFQGLLSDARRRAFTMDMVSALNQRGLVRLSFLTADHQSISGVLGFEYGGRFYYYRPAFDPDYAKYAPGHMHIFYLFRESASRGVTEFDFLRGDQPYKRVWASSTRNVVTLLLVKRGAAGEARLNLLRLIRKISRLRQDGKISLGLCL